MIHKEEVVTYISDVTNEKVENVESVAIKRGNRFHVIDVDAAHVDEELGKITVAEAIARGRVETIAQHSGRNRRAELHAQARAFARGKGIDIGTRGSVSNEIVEEYLQAEEAAKQADMRRGDNTEQETAQEDAHKDAHKDAQSDDTQDVEKNVEESDETI